MARIIPILHRCGPKCPIRQSAHRAFYEKMRREGSTLQTIFDYATKTFGDKISYVTFYRHMDSLVDSNSMLMEKGREAIQTMDEILAQLTLAKGIVQTLASDSEITKTPQKLYALRGMMAEIRQTFQFIEKLNSELKIEAGPSKDELVLTLMDLLQDFPPEVKDQLCLKLQTQLSMN